MLGANRWIPANMASFIPCGAATNASDDRLYTVTLRKTRPSLCSTVELIVNNRNSEWFASYASACARASDTAYDSSAACNAGTKTATMKPTKNTTTNKYSTLPWPRKRFG